MKKSVFALLATAIATTASAQPPTIGIKGGLNIASVSFPGDADLGTRLSGHGGLVVHGHITPNIGIQPEVLYSGQGFKQNFMNIENEWKLGYLNVPIMVQYMFRNGFRIEAGPQVGLLLNAKQEDPTGTTDRKAGFKQTDFAAAFGLNYLSSSGFGIGGRYNLGLTNINKEPGANVIKNRVGQVSIFYMFGGNHKQRSR